MAAKKTKKAPKKVAAKKTVKKSSKKTAKKPHVKALKKLVKKVKVKRVQEDVAPPVETFVKQDQVEASVDANGVVTMVPVKS